jgi:hypothetical protein
VSARQYYAWAAVASGFLVAGAVRWRASVPAVPHQSKSMGLAVPVFADSIEAILAEAEEVTVSNDPFRLSNSPPAVRYDPKNENSGVASPGMSVPVIRPSLTLKAIVGGPPWQAIVDGIPGQPTSTLVRAGATYDRLIARAVTRDSVVIQGPDTTWVLSFRRRE